jgi:hypothetical protein
MNLSSAGSQRGEDSLGCRSLHREEAPSPADLAGCIRRYRTKQKPAALWREGLAGERLSQLGANYNGA